MSSVYSVEIKTHKAKRHVRSRDREPSRIPAKKISRLLKKSRKLRTFIRRHIRRNVPKSSHIFRLFKASSRERQRLLSINQARYPIYTCSRTTTSREPFVKRSRCFIRRFINHKKLKLCKTHKSLNHIINCCKFNLSRDIKTDPGHVFVEPTKTSTAPYRHGNVAVLCPNAGTQWLSMGLCVLV